MSHPKKEKSNTDNQGWTIKGIEIETRVAIQKAAKKEGTTLGKYCNAKLREAANNTLRIGSNILVQPKDIRDEVTTQINTLKQDLPLMIKLALEEESRGNQKSFLKRIFG